MNIVLAGHFPFPFGSASASRVRHITTGLSELGHQVFVITMVLVKGDADDTQGRDWLVHQGVRYFHAAGVWPPQSAGSRRRKVWLFVAGLRRGLVGAQRKIRALQRNPGVDVVIGYSQMYFGFHGLVRFCKRSGIRIVRDVVEWMGPDSLAGGRVNPFYWNAELGYRLSLPQSDGIIGISTFLTDWFAAKGLRTLRIPAIIDPQIGPREAARRTKHPDGPFQLTYLGNMVWRDGPMLMLKAVREVISAGHEVFFNVVGATERIRSAAEAKAFAEGDELLRDRIRFWGRVSDAEVRDRLQASDALIFTRLSGRRARAAFPTRLPEYLTTGNPVIASGVSDIPEYLRDGKDAIIVAPDSVSALAEGIIRLLSLPDRGRSIGQSGRQRCRECFNYRSHCREIARFLEQSIAARG